MGDNVHKIKVNPIRIIPFDIGCEINSEMLEGIKGYLDSKYTKRMLTAAQESILLSFPLCYTINSNVDLYIFISGIGVILIKDNGYSIKDDIQHFAIEYCENRMSQHSKILMGSHTQSQVINNVVKDLKKYIIENQKGNKKIRESGMDNFEYNGFSYVMTMSFLEVINDRNLACDLEKLPLWAKKNIAILLNPSAIGKDDSMKFENNNLKKSDLIKIIDNYSEVDMNDVEKRKYISTFMSWAAVLVLGTPTGSDIEEYISLEVELQHNWYYIYCLSKTLDGNIKELSSRGYDIIRLRMMSYELELLESKLNFIDDSSLPDRIKLIQGELINSSGISDIINRYKRKIAYCSDTLLFEGQERQKRYGLSTEILLYVIAFIQVAPMMYEFIDKIIHNSTIATVIVILIFVIGVVFFILKQ